MTDLALQKVLDDQFLLLTDEAGNEYRLTATEELFTAVQRIRAHSAHGFKGDAPVRPKVIQSMIRSGMSAQDVADATGAAVEHVRMYEGPILAERRHIARQAGLCPVYPANDPAQAPRPLAELAQERLQLREVDLDTVTWDAWRTQTGSWHVELSFTAAGRPRTAAWEYLRGSVNALDDEARWLSDSGPTDSGPIPNYGSAAERVFNIEADRQQAERTHVRDHQTETGRILESLRRRREAADTASRPAPRTLHSVPATPAEAPDGAHTALSRPQDATDDSIFALPQEANPNKSDAAAPQGSPAAPQPDAEPHVQPSAAEQPAAPQHNDTQPLRTEAADAQPAARQESQAQFDFPDQPSLLDEPGVTDSADSESAAPAGANAADHAEEKAEPKADSTAKPKGRASVPSWDEIMFGAKKD